MKFEKRYWVPVAIVFCLFMGIASAAVLLRTGSSDNLVNIFERTKNECPNLKWVGSIDTTETVSPVTVQGELFF